MTDVEKMGSGFKTIKDRANSYKLVCALFASARKSYTCQLCLKKFYSEPEVQKHFHAQHKEKAKRLFPDFVDSSFRCARCDFRVGFASEDAIRQHLRQMHGDEEETSAPVPPLSLFPPSASLLPSWYLQCSTCDRSHLSRESLLQHIRQRHLDLAPHHCDTCGLAFSSKKRWDQHLYTTHGGVQQSSNSSSLDVAASKGEFNGGRMQVVQQQQQQQEAPIHTFRLDGDRLVQISGGTVGQQFELETSSDGASPAKRVRYELAGTTPDGKQVLRQVLLTEQEQVSGAEAGQQQVIALNLTQEQQQVVHHQVLDDGSVVQYVNEIDLQQAATMGEELSAASTPTTMYKCPACDHLELLESSIVAHIKSTHVAAEDAEEEATVSLGQQQQQQNLHGLFPDEEEREDVLRIIQKARETTEQQQQQQQLLLQQQQTQQEPPALPETVQQQQYQCSACGLQTPQMPVMLQHLKDAHGVDNAVTPVVSTESTNPVSNSKRVKCNLCTNTYADSNGLKRHFKKVHAGGGEVLSCNLDLQ